MRRGERQFVGVHMIAVGMMEVAVVQVVHMILVLDGRMAAPRPVRVRVSWVGLAFCRHRASSCVRGERFRRARSPRSRRRASKSSRSSCIRSRVNPRTRAGLPMRDGITSRGMPLLVG